MWDPANVFHFQNGEIKMTQGIVLLLLLFVAGLPARTSGGRVAGVPWSVRASKPVFKSGEPKIVIYELANQSGSKVLVPKSVNPLMSVRFHFYDSDGHPMHWNGAHY